VPLGNAQISTDVVCRYAADAAREVPGVHGLLQGHLPVGHRSVRLSTDEDRTRVELHLAVEWGASIPEVGRAVQQRVRTYLRNMIDLEVDAVDVVIDEVSGPSSGE
jgi:uncharacterized alkaline shock family protein YloU